MNTSNYMKYKDLQYEQSNIGYKDRYKDRYKNYKLCEFILSCKWWIYMTTWMCPSYDMFGTKDLEFKENTEECDVCNESYKYVKVSTSCEHQFCAPCSQNILVWDETNYRLSPVPFGCPPCPNNCINPIKGEQCYCEEYDEILDQWKEEYPDKYEEYNDAEKLSIELSETTEGIVYGSYKCPLCVKKITC